MEITQVLGSLLIFILCPLLGGLPLIGWITYALTGKQLRQIGTRNISVSAAFYHGGKIVGGLAVLSEALKGIAAVLLAMYFFPIDPEWHIIALLSLVWGRYWIGKGAGTTNAVWGYTLHDPLAGFLVFLFSGIAFTILREKQQGRLASLILLPLVTALLHPSESALILMTIALSLMLGWIYQHIPDDLELTATEAQASSQSMFKFFRGDRVAANLDQPLLARKVGAKAATLAALKRAGYPVPPGWVLAPGDDPAPLIEFLQPSAQAPVVVRSSAIGEDAVNASSAGQYESVLGITQPDELMAAITRCLNSYDRPAAVQYRRAQGLPEASMNVLIQPQIMGVFSGVAFSRDPIARQGDAVIIEALPGDATQVVSGRVTPEQYRVIIPHPLPTTPGLLPDDMTFEVEGEAGDLPPRLLQQVAYLARQLEQRYHGMPQDIEWTSEQRNSVWLLQARPITTLLPIWTRKIAAEVIPGAIRPLTWSINRPLTCGVWGQLFALGLGDRARGLEVNTLATLHYSHAYFNASLLGDLFRRMGLPPESLEFLTLGAKFNRPPLLSTLQNAPGLLRLAQREWTLIDDFRRDDRKIFTPALAELSQPIAEPSPNSLLERIDRILNLLESVTFYSIMAPLSAALRKSIGKVDDNAINADQTPEVAALRALQELALAARQILPPDEEQSNAANAAATLFAELAKTKSGQGILTQFDQLLAQYGYLSEVGTDIAVPTWKEDPQPIKALVAQFYWHPPARSSQPRRKSSAVQRRFDLKGRVTEVYSKLLAELRWSFVALEQIWLKAEVLAAVGDIFFLEFAEVRSLIATSHPEGNSLRRLIQQRQIQFQQDQQRDRVPGLVYGDDPPVPQFFSSDRPASQLQGIGASPGVIEGQIKVLKSLQAVDVTKETILVVPYTDSGWAPLLARAGGLIAEVGGRLSHGAIVAREYRIPAVMNLANAMTILQDGQRVRIDGRSGSVEILAE
jgi:phosphohistidine swiveling domain-containing protein/glycerol-3-phosphate acyltransferase PlsY